MRRQHRLFQHYPLDGEIEIDGETHSTPYHIYDGSILFIGGRADADAAKELLRDEDLVPILDQDGHALFGLWLCDFTQANLGPHHELQVSIFATHRAMPPVAAHRFAILRLLINTPETHMICHGLWNNTQRVVSYNRQHLMLDARLCESEFDIDRAAGRWRFTYMDASSRQPLLTGDIALAERQSPAVLWELSRQFGIGGLIRMMRTPFIHVPVVNTRSAAADKNLVAHTYTRADRQTIAPFDETNRLTLSAPQYQALRIQPDFVQYNQGVRFVYLRPENPQS